MEQVIRSAIDTLVTNKTGSQSHQSLLLENIWNFAELEANRQIILENVDFLKFLKTLLATATDLELIQRILGCLWFLSRSEKAHPLIMDPQLGLAPFLLDYFLHPLPYISKNALNTICNCSLSLQCHQYMLSSELNYVATFHEGLIQHPSRSDCYRFFATIITSMKNHNLDAFIEYDIVSLLINKLLFAGSNPEVWNPRFGGAEDQAFNFLTSLSTLPKGREILFNHFEIIEFFISILPENNMEGMRAFIILVNVFQDLPRCKKRCEIEFHPHLEILLGNILELHVNPKNEDLYLFLSNNYGFEFGMLTVRDFTTFAFSLLLVPKNREHFFLSSREASKILSDLMFLFIRIVDNAKPITRTDHISVQEVGGGGEDEESLIMLLRFFLLIFSSEESFSVPNSQLRQIDYFDRYLNGLRVLVRINNTERKWTHLEHIQCLASLLLDQES